MEKEIGDQELVGGLDEERTIRGLGCIECTCNRSHMDVGFHVSGVGGGGTDVRRAQVDHTKSRSVGCRQCAMD